MKLSKQARRDAKQLYRSCVNNGVLDENRVRQAVTAVIEKKPRGHDGILSHLVRLVKLDIARHTAKVESPAPLSSAQQETLRAELAKKYGAGLQLSFAEDSSLLGGLRIQVGSDVYDGSVKARLESLADSF